MTNEARNPNDEDSSPIRHCAYGVACGTGAVQLLRSHTLSPSDGGNHLPNQKIHAVLKESHMPVPKQDIDSAWMLAAGAGVDVF